MCPFCCGPFPMLFVGGGHHSKVPAQVGLSLLSSAWRVRGASLLNGTFPPPTVGGPVTGRCSSCRSSFDYVYIVPVPGAGPLWCRPPRMPADSVRRHMPAASARRHIPAASARRPMPAGGQTDTPPCVWVYKASEPVRTSHNEIGDLSDTVLVSGHGPYLTGSLPLWISFVCDPTGEIVNSSR